MSMMFFSSGLFEVFFVLTFLLFISVFLFMLISRISQWNKNNHSPRLTVGAVVITKRTNVHGDTGHTSGSTSYYVTFQVESGDRMELHVSGSEYGMLAEGDRGFLTFQGTRYLGFERV